MSAAAVLDPVQRESIHELAGAVVNHSQRLARLAMRHVTVDVSRSQASLLGAVATQPRRITELAEYEGLAQPRITALVASLEQRGWVRREREPHDRRAVRVSITAQGEEVLAQMRSDVAAAVEAGLASMSPRQLEALMAATQVADVLIDALEKRD